MNSRSIKVLRSLTYIRSLFVAPGSSLRFQLSREQGAVFITSQDTFCVDAIQKERFKNYGKRHCKAWEEYARSKEVGDVDLILISGVDQCQDFAMLTYAANDRQFSAEVTAEIPPLASTWVDVWRTRDNVATMHYNWLTGATMQRAEQLDISSPLETSTIMAQSREAYIPFVRALRTKVRSSLFPARLQAAAEPKDIEESHNSEDGGDGNIVISNTLEVWLG